MATNWGIGSEMANGIKEGMIAYQTNKKLQRDQQMQDLSSGIVRDPDTGEVSFTPMKQQELAFKQKQTEQGLAEYDPNSTASKLSGLLLPKLADGQSYPEGMTAADVSGATKGLIAPTIHNQGMATVQGMKNDSALNIQNQKGQNAIDVANTKGGYQSDIAKMKNDTMTSLLQSRNDIQLDRLNRQHVNDIQKNPQLIALQTTHDNLDNALQNFQKGGATTQEFSELQQAVRSNLGLKGAGGVGEREETYLKSLGISGDKVKQFLSGNPQSVLESDPAFAKQITGLVHLEMANKEKQYKSIMDGLVAGKQSFINKPGNQNRAQDIAGLVSNKQAAMNKETPQAQTGLLGAQPQTNAPQQQAKPKSVVQNGHTYILNEVTGKYE